MKDMIKETRLQTLKNLDYVVPLKNCSKEFIFEDQTSTKQLNIRNVKGMVSRDFVLQFFWLNTFYLGPVWTG